MSAKSQQSLNVKIVSSISGEEVPAANVGNTCHSPFRTSDTGINKCLSTKVTSRYTKSWTGPGAPSVPHVMFIFTTLRDAQLLGSQLGELNTRNKAWSVYLAVEDALTMAMVRHTVTDYTDLPSSRVVTYDDVGAVDFSLLGRCRMPKPTSPDGSYRLDYQDSSTTRIDNDIGDLRKHNDYVYKMPGARVTYSCGGGRSPSIDGNRSSHSAVCVLDGFKEGGAQFQPPPENVSCLEPTCDLPKDTVLANVESPTSANDEPQRQFSVNTAVTLRVLEGRYLFEVNEDGTEGGERYKQIDVECQLREGTFEAEWRSTARGMRVDSVHLSIVLAELVFTPTEEWSRHVGRLWNEYLHEMSPRTNYTVISLEQGDAFLHDQSQSLIGQSSTIVHLQASGLHAKSALSALQYIEEKIQADRLGKDFTLEFSVGLKKRDPDSTLQAAAEWIWAAFLVPEVIFLVWLFRQARTMENHSRRLNAICDTDIHNKCNDASAVVGPGASSGTGVGVDVDVGNIGGELSRSEVSMDHHMILSDGEDFDESAYPTFDSDDAAEHSSGNETEVWVLKDSLVAANSVTSDNVEHERRMQSDDEKNEASVGSEAQDLASAKRRYSMVRRDAVTPDNTPLREAVSPREHQSS